MSVHVIIFIVLIGLVFVLGIIALFIQFIANICAKEFAKEFEYLFAKYVKRD